MREKSVTSGADQNYYTTILNTSYRVRTAFRREWKSFRRHIAIMVHIKFLQRNAYLEIKEILSEKTRKLHFRTIS